MNGIGAHRTPGSKDSNHYQAFLLDSHLYPNICFVISSDYFLDSRKLPMHLHHFLSLHSLNFGHLTKKWPYLSQFQIQDIKEGLLFAQCRESVQS